MEASGSQKTGSPMRGARTLSARRRTRAGFLMVAAVLLETVSYALIALIFVICIDVAGDAVCIIVRIDLVSLSVAVIGVGNAIVVATGRTS